VSADATIVSRTAAGGTIRHAGWAARARGWRGPLVAASLFLAIHLAYLAPTLDDIDAVNFASGVRSFDPALHRPHPPGYPVYVALGKATTPIANAVRPPGPLAPLGRDPAALALALWSAVCGAICLLASFAVFVQLEALDDLEPGGGAARVGPAGMSGRSPAFWAAVLAACAPLAWFSASRPMSDVPGLAGALVAQAFLLEAWRRDMAGEAGARLLPLGAAAAGLALGVRSQVLWLTLPLLVASLVTRARRLGLRTAIPGAGAYALAVAAWFVPMLLVTGWQRYLAALGGQGTEDFSGVDMLWTHFGARRLAVGLWQTLVLPWSFAPLGLVVVAAALAGVVVMWRRARVSLACLALLAAPYAVFHTLFHETVTTRYALPLLPAIGYLAVRACAALGRRAAVALLVLVIGASLAVGMPAIRSYAKTASPIFQALTALQAESAAGEAGAALGMHRRVSTEGRVALAWAGLAPWARRLPSPRAEEWAQALRVLREEPGRTVWFLGEPSRRGELRVRDLALIDPRAVRSVAEFGWNVSAAGLLDGVRPDEVDLYEIREPGWVARDGWALTPETAGMADKMKRGPAFGPIEALIRRRRDEVLVLVGGRHLGGAGEGAARVEIRIDGRPAGDFLVDPQPQFFLRMLRLPAGTLDGAGAFGVLTIAATPAVGAARPTHVAIEQFDVDGVDGLLAGYDTGWQEPEYEPSRQQLWRWMSERATVLVHAGGTGRLTLRLAAESPRRYFDRASEVTIRVGDAVLWRQTPDANLPRLFARVLGAGRVSATVPVDRDALSRASGRITIEADQFFVPADRDQNSDSRHLALRVLDLQVTRAN
jgi:hypothetical protein